MKKFQDRILPALRSFDPDLILLSAGFDAGKNDEMQDTHLDIRLEWIYNPRM